MDEAAGVRERDRLADALEDAAAVGAGRARLVEVIAAASGPCTRFIT